MRIAQLLEEEFLGPLDMSREVFANHIGVRVEVIDALMIGEPISPFTARKLAYYFDTTADDWMMLNEVHR